MRVLFAGGGTGGHINPAISIADYIKSKDDTFEALFIGTKRGLEVKLVPKAGYKIEYIDIIGINRKNPIKNIEVLKKFFKAKKKCAEIMKSFKPDMVVCTGGYVSGPVATVAHKLKIPSIIHEQNVYPGLTVKGAQKYVNYVATSFEETKNHLKEKNKCVFTGNPVRYEILTADKEKSREMLGISEKPFVLIFGGSLGAQKINENVVKILKRISDDDEIKLLFGTGERNYEEIKEKIKHMELSKNVMVVPYIDNMHTVMSASDVVVSRAGAITVSEIAVLNKPSILIPSPNVVRNHQEQNARELERNAAAMVLCENELNPDSLYDKIMELCKNHKKREEMSLNLKKIAVPDALEKLYELIIKCTDK